MNNDLFKALSDPTRREILMLLQKQTLNAGEIAKHFTISKPSISHHLGILLNANLVISEKKGQYVYFTINSTVIQDLLIWLFKFKK